MRDLHWGDPDLQGIWEYWTFTPLEKPDELSDRDTLTDEEAAAVAQQGLEAARATDDGAREGYSGAVGQ